jgi:hypothetical protein
MTMEAWEEWEPPWVEEPGEVQVGSMYLLKHPYLQHERFSYGYGQDAVEFAATTTYAKPKYITGVLVDEGEVWLTGAKNPKDLGVVYWRHS